MEPLPPTHSHSHSRRASPIGKPPPPPRVTRALSMKSSKLVGLQLVAALDESYPPPTTLVSPFTSVRRPRSDSTMSSDTFDGIYSLGDGVDDVDMVADDELGEIDVDEFRPGALLDRRLEDEFGSTRTSDLERMLLAGGEAEDEEDTAAVIAHLARLDSMDLDHEKAKKKDTGKGGFCALAPVGNAAAVLVVAAAAVVDARHSACSSQHLQIAAALPPKYDADQKRRAHCRTFGERTSSFNFRFATAAETTQPQPQPQPQTSPVATMKAGLKRGRSLFQEAAEDIACRDVDREDKENLPPTDVPVSENEHEKMDDIKMEVESSESNTASADDHPTSQQLQLQPQTPVRPLNKITADVFQTPLRRSATAPVTSCHTQASFQTPVAAAAGAESKTPTAGVTLASTMSPAPSFDKVAVVHAKDTPGRVDKFEWTIRPREAIRAKTVLFSTEPTTPQTTEPLPPRYLGDASTGSPQKRRIHSTTFGTFARSFSFTATK